MFLFFRVQGKSTKKKGLALTALTLLAFLFFLHYLQTCIEDHFDDMQPQVLIMQTKIKAKGKERKIPLAKQSDNLDASFEDINQPSLQLNDQKEEYFQVPQ